MEEVGQLGPQVDGIISKCRSDSLIAKMWNELNWMTLKEILEFSGDDNKFPVSENSEYFDNLRQKQRSKRKINPNFFFLLTRGD